MIWFYEEDPHALHSLIKHIYGYNYDYSGAEDNLEKFANSASETKSFVSLYVVGQKYLVPQACIEAKATLIATLERMPGTEQYLSTLGEVVQQVYVTYALEATDLREMLVTHFMQHAVQAAEKEQLRDLFKLVPDFAFDVTTASMEQQRNPVKAVKLAVPGKRERM